MKSPIEEFIDKLTELSNEYNINLIGLYYAYLPEELSPVRYTYRPYSTGVYEIEPVMIHEK